MPYRRGSRETWSFMAATRTGRKQLSSGSQSKSQATRIESMWHILADEHRAWDLLDPVLDGETSVETLYDAWQDTRHDLGEMRRRLADVDIVPLVEEYLAHYGGLGKHDTSADKIRSHLRWLFPVGSTRKRTTVTPASLTAKLGEYAGIPRAGQKLLPPITPGTRRRVHSAWSGFFAYLASPQVSTGPLFATNLMDAVTRPKAATPPIRFYELREILLLLDQAPSSDMRALWALLYATSIDISTAIQLRRQDFDELRREVRAPGTKAHARDRICRVADWAWEIVAEFLADKALGDLLWPGWNQWTPTDAHRVATKAAKLRPLLPLRCSRHSWAVRAAKAGTPIAIIVAQLGHGSPQLALTRYGRFMPQAVDRDRWEKQAAERDAEAMHRAKNVQAAVQSAVHRDEHPKNTKPHRAQLIAAMRFRNSRGGTRTRDPGIMSAVL